MSDNKSFRARQSEGKQDITTFFGTTTGLIIAGVVTVAVIGGIIWQAIASIL